MATFMPVNIQSETNLEKIAANRLFIVTPFLRNVKDSRLESVKLFKASSIRERHRLIRMGHSLLSWAIAGYVIRGGPAMSMTELVGLSCATSCLGSMRGAGETDEF